ncbi:transcriptional regulator [Rhodococcus wratislaviensis]|uniref:LysR family transcriptional regulator n=1 Tax=Rhodococcus wratislaviensis TaxID=44752 RepID=A0AB38F932_RHOWR|nr:LysR family transcriptional regulator [Rhodococcus wratislaviensis]REE73103.1 transcriptional regulator [Rhodococcus wratislaviensis]SPZ37893.1 LysR family transcriptional regulator [Rhodococcus wratislaviensis]
MRLTQLHYFDSAVRLGSLRAAADHLGVSQPTLSEQLRALEEELGVVLLVRGRRGVTVTTAGEAILDNVHSALAAETAIRQQASAITGLSQGLTRIGSIGIVARTFLPGVMSRLVAAHPGLEFQVLEAGSVDIRRDVLSGDLDLGLIARRPDEPADTVSGLHVVPLLTTRVLVCAPKGHPLSTVDEVTMDQLAAYPLVLFPENFVLRRVVDEHFGSRTPMIVQAGTLETLHAMVAAGLGVALEAELGSRIPAPRIDLVGVPFAGPPSTLEISLIYRNAVRPSSSATAVIGLTRKAAAQWRDNDLAP